MQPEDPLLEQLKRWGHVTASRFAANEDGPSRGDNVLSKQQSMALAHKRKQQDERELVGRDGEARRRLMAAGANAGLPGGRTTGMHIVPTWAVDPIRASNDADAPRDRPPVAFVDLMPDELLWIDRAVHRLLRENRVRGLVLRAEFAERGTHRMKAAIVEREYGGTLTVRQYRLELQRAMDWMRGRMAA